MKRIIWTAVVTAVVVVLGEWALMTILMYSGVYNVTQLNHDDAFLNWYFDHGATRSVDAHSGGITAPPLNDPALVQEGFKHYEEMCVQCHGAPGKSPGEIAKGLWPEAPDLSKTVPQWTAAQLFWITKYGIKFTAMPAWGPTHSDSKLWAMTAFLEKLPHLSAADYHEMETNTTHSGEEETSTPAPARPKTETEGTAQK